MCSDNMFKCNNSVCVEKNHLCDYSDDCGDDSDENNCGEISQSFSVIAKNYFFSGCRISVHLLQLLNFCLLIIK